MQIVHMLLVSRASEAAVGVRGDGPKAKVMNDTFSRPRTLSKAQATISEVLGDFSISISALITNMSCFSLR
jgi:hypothetical protein